ncbi:MAG: serine/threonine-protein phosphatase, partial [Planctomycetes bacterium]|nr:serine/threonine-protein phosphatase [Planctomycetota bacterium]
RLTLVNAGHPRPYVCFSQTGGCEEIQAEAGFPLGVVEGADYSTQCRELGPGPCTLFFYTDGVIEAMNQQGEQFTSGRMIEVLQSGEDPHPATLIKRMRSGVEAFCQGAPQSDDITMLAVQLP